MKNTFNTIIIGGGASGLFCASKLSKTLAGGVLVVEKNNRLGKKLAATGNGQGNVTNINLTKENYHGNKNFIKNAISQFNNVEFLSFLKELGGIFVPKENGRIYPLSMQAASVCDLLRHWLDATNCQILLQANVTCVKKQNQGFLVVINGQNYYAQNVVLATGGAAAPQFGTDGSSYSIAKSFGHTLSELAPSLVQLKTNTTHIKSLKGVKVNCNACIKLGGATLSSAQGDVLFTDYGVSGNTVFELSAYAQKGATLHFNFLPEVARYDVEQMLLQKSKGNIEAQELFCTILNKQLAREILKRANVAANAQNICKSIGQILDLCFDFSLQITGDMGFKYAQVTKGGILVEEICEHSFMSKKCPNLYLIGELLNVDGDCGGYNIQWAYSSASVAAKNILKNA